jgi:histidyl-tRNA synthetase
MADIQRARGVRDFGPDEMEFRRSVEGRIRRSFEGMGYREISTPTFEHSELFVAKSGIQVLEQMYTFKDKGGRELALRPELTAPVMRFFASDLKNEPKPLRIYYFGNCFRYERPQKGRFREFWQIGLEYIGNRTPLANAEVINASIRALQSVDLDEFVVRVGNVRLLSMLLARYEIDTARDREMMIAIDKKDRDAILRSSYEGGEDLAELITRTYESPGDNDFLDRIPVELRKEMKVPLEESKTILEMLSKTGAGILFDPSISRGLDYYDGTVFEIDAPGLGAEKQICGGGEYSLSSLLGKNVEGIGFGLGFDRIVMALGDVEHVEREQKHRFYLLPLGDRALEIAIEISGEIMDCGADCLIETAGRNFGKAINYAVGQGCASLLIIGDEELDEGTISIKDLATQEQVSIRREDLKDHVKRILD